MPSDPNSPPPSFSVPGEAPGPGYPPPSAPDQQYAPPPPTSGGGYPPPTSGAGYGQPTSGGGYQQPGYQQPGYQQPGQPGYQQPGQAYGAGYQQPGYQQPGVYGAPGAGPVGYANSDEKTWALIAHFGGALFGFLAPLIALLAKGNESPTVKAHATEALNFQITYGVALILTWIIGACTVVLIFVPLLLWIYVIVMAIVGGMKANGGELYRYPATLRLIK